MTQRYGPDEMGNTPLGNLGDLWVIPDDQQFAGTRYYLRRGDGGVWIGHALHWHIDQRKDEDPRHTNITGSRNPDFCFRCHRWVQGYGAPGDSTQTHPLVCDGERRQREV